MDSKHKTCTVYTVGPYISQTKNSGARDSLNKKKHTEQWEGGILLCDVQAHMWPNLALRFHSTSGSPRKRPKHKAPVCARPQSDMDAVGLGLLPLWLWKEGGSKHIEHKALCEAP